MDEKELNQAPIQPQEETEEVVDIERIVADLQAQGLENEAILEALTQMLQEGKITDEDLARAKELLDGAEKDQASELFGVDIL